jgi:hypothetical protein
MRSGRKHTRSGVRMAGKDNCTQRVLGDSRAPTVACPHRQHRHPWRVRATMVRYVTGVRDGRRSRLARPGPPRHPTGPRSGTPAPDRGRGRQAVLAPVGAGHRHLGERPAEMQSILCWGALDIHRRPPPANGKTRGNVTTSPASGQRPAMSRSRSSCGVTPTGLRPGLRSCATLMLNPRPSWLTSIRGKR